MRRCSSSSTARTSACAETSETAADTAGRRISWLTSRSAATMRPSARKRDARLASQSRERGAVVGGHALAQSEIGHRPVHRAGVQVGVAEPRRQQPGQRALARPGRAVDGDHGHAGSTSARTSVKPGNVRRGGPETTHAHSGGTDQAGDRAEHGETMVAAAGDRAAAQGRAATRKASPLASTSPPRLVTISTIAASRSLSLARRSATPSMTVSPSA